eukprot:CAMPEP_0117082632 /NCGR_PEP_ID=MMETSP0472-20121206/58189_1 /TAXON_ID=693140 ORGANISM="Tiarina fusus, Strain LIS" /NCGR_SAMPLE_ID=MMETSP0472 /ASSEMBLY_ACC=CAM_ASM_000603 /LENGTH=246 /DNA_ID=CAMNT_0004810949 /DNA_START=193 /DNA_END=930 /DNA_ORIENTATION=+
MKYKDRKFIPPLPKGYSLHSTFYELVKWNKEMDVMRAVTLLFYGADTEQTDEFGLTPLMQASIADNWLYVQALVLHGKNIIAVDSQRWTALHHAAYQNNYRSLQVLTRGLKDFDLTTLTDYAMDTPMGIAARTSVQALQEDFHEASCEEDEEVVEVTESAGVEEKDSDIFVVKNWKRAADSGSSSELAPKAQEKKSLLGLDLLSRKREKTGNSGSNAMKSLKKQGKRAISRTDLKRRASNVSLVDK